LLVLKYSLWNHYKWWKAAGYAAYPAAHALQRRTFQKVRHWEPLLPQTEKGLWKPLKATGIQRIPEARTTSYRNLSNPLDL